MGNEPDKDSPAGLLFTPRCSICGKSWTRQIPKNSAYIAECPGECFKKKLEQIVARKKATIAPKPS